jgi:hypothetical protein
MIERACHDNHASVRTDRQEQASLIKITVQFSFRKALDPKVDNERTSVIVKARKVNQASARDP